MAKDLTTTIENQVTNKDIKKNFIFKISSTDYTSKVISYTIKHDSSFGSSSSKITLLNEDGQFGENGSTPIYLGDVVEVIEQFGGDSTEWKSFYGRVDQRSYSETSSERTVTLNCLDYISVFRDWDINLDAEATKVEVTNETLTPSYLPAPNDTLAQVFNFANDSIAQLPAPVLTIRDKSDQTEDPRSDGFEIYYENGQVKFSNAINAHDNYDVICKSYHWYPRGLYAEDILEDIIIEPDGYGNYIFGESSAQNVIDNHLKDTFSNVEGSSTDTLTCNLTSTEIEIYQQLAENYDPDSSTSNILVLNSTDGLPSSGTATVSGDSFTWSSKDSTTLYGVSESGSTALKTHTSDSYVKYTATYSPGQVWYMTYSNITDTLTGSDFDLPSGSSVSYVDHRFGRIILDSAINVSATVQCTTNYTFKTLQASGIELNGLKLNSREVEDRFEGIKKLKEYLPPNYVVRTQGDNKIWASLLSQKTTADYTLNLRTSANFLEDEDLYTRVKFFRKNKNPTNILFDSGVGFLTTGESYKATATQDDLSYKREEGNYYVYGTAISSAGRIVTTDLVPIVYINGVPINNTSQQIVQAPVQVIKRERTETKTDGKGGVEEVNTYTDYDVYFAHSSIDINSDIEIYNDVGVVIYTIPAGDSTGRNGYMVFGGGNANSTVESFSTASYKVFYSTEDLVIDHDEVEFKISKSLLPDRVNNEVSATFEYYNVLTSVSGIDNAIDGRWDTQVQTVFYSKPPSGYNYAILDLGAEKTIQAIDLVAGFYKPDDIRKFDVDMTLTLKYSTDNVNYYEMGSSANNIDLKSGDSITLEEEDLGYGFSARYIKLVIEDISKLEYDDGVWVVAFSEFAAYNDIILSSEATLISTTTLAEDIDVESLGSSGVYPTAITVDSTEGFTDPESGETATAYIGDDSFTYTGVQSGNTFIGVEGLSENHSSGDRVSQNQETDTTVYDDFSLLPKLGDKLYKNVDISDSKIFSQSDLDDLAKAYLEEYVKNHSKMKVDVLFSPFLKIGQTVSVTDTYMGYTSVNYFIESITNTNGFYSLVLARYPGD